LILREADQGAKVRVCEMQRHPGTKWPEIAPFQQDVWIAGARDDSAANHLTQPISLDNKVLRRIRIGPAFHAEDLFRQPIWNSAGCVGACGLQSAFARIKHPLSAGARA